MADNFNGTILISDLESTGIDITAAGVCQVAAVAMYQVSGEWQLHPLLQTYASPSYPMPPEALAVHGITPEMYQYAPRDVMAIWVLRQLIDALPKPVVLSGYNCTRYDYPLMDQLNREAKFDQFQQIDVMTLMLRESPEQGLKLTEVFERLINDQNLLNSAHDALADCMMTGMVLEHYLKQFPTDPLVLAQWVNTPIEMEIMPWGKHKGTEFHKVPRSYLQWMASKWTDMHPDLALSLRNKGLMA